MKKYKITKKILIINISVLFATTMLVPSLTIPTNTISHQPTPSILNTATNNNKEPSEAKEYNPTLPPNYTPDMFQYDKSYDSEEKTKPLSLDAEDNDAGYNTDAGDTLPRGLPIYPGEITDNAPGRTGKGTLNPSNDDPEDWYRFWADKGQTITASLSSTQGYDYELADNHGEIIGKSLTTSETAIYFLRIYAPIITGLGEYTFSVTLSGQNDAGTEGDAGNSYETSTPITPGSYTGYMDSTDQEDWYSFTASNGQGIIITINPLDKSDYDLHLYNPTGELVHSAQYYGRDELSYPADRSGTWTFKIDMFPGWDTNKWPTNYYLYGSGPYSLDLTIGAQAEPLPNPVKQPEITPIAQTFYINNDQNNNQDEYTYLACIPAANYIENDKHHVSPIVYKNEITPSHWFGTIDDTTKYLLEDWDTYLARHNMETTHYEIEGDPINAAAEIATMKWPSTETAVIVIDGSNIEDTTETILEETATLQMRSEVITTPPENLRELTGEYTAPIFIGPEWGAITVYAVGNNVPHVGIINPRYEPSTESEWPHPYDTPGDSTNIYFPIPIPGMYFPYTGGTSGSWNLQVTKYAGDRYKIPISNTDTTIKVTVTTPTPEYLKVFLVDPYGNIRRPSIPHWNGGPINPLHVWNGGHWEGIGFEQWRRWEPTLSTEHTVEVHHPMTGKWTAIVVPHYPFGEEQTSDNFDYQIKAELRTHNPNRVAAALSAANGAVIASQNHIPLLYVTEDEVPPATTNALTTLGTKNLIFVNIDNNGEDIKQALGSYTLTDLDTFQKVINYVKADANSENFITITSLATGEGYFAPAAMAAAYHGGPVLDMGEAPLAYDIIDKLQTWREYGGDWYHGCRAQGHLPDMESPFNPLEVIRGLLNGEVPGPGFDLKLRWYSGAHDALAEYITGLNLNGEGKEGYLFVSPRDRDIRDVICRVMTGNNSYAGMIPVETPAFSSAVICRNILYPAVIYANPGRHVTSSCFTNFRDGLDDWTLNNGEEITSYFTPSMKEIMLSHGRFYEGHTLWNNLLERYNSGASVIYHCSHGTGGSGICCMYENIAEQFPQAELRHEHLHDFNWWDGWRGYFYDGTITRSPRWGGLYVWLNPEEPNLYDIVHFKWCDQLFDNLHSQFNLWQSCTTGAHFGPMIYLEHGAALFYANAGTGRSPQEELFDIMWFTDMMVNGLSIGESLSNYVWLHQRDYTTKDPIALYGPSSMVIYNVQVLFGDPSMVCYSPEWIEPIPINP